MNWAASAKDPMMPNRSTVHASAFEPFPLSSHELVDASMPRAARARKDVAEFTSKTQSAMSSPRVSASCAFTRSSFSFATSLSHSTIGLSADLPCTSPGWARSRRRPRVSTPMSLFSSFSVLLSAMWSSLRTHVRVKLRELEASVVSEATIPATSAAQYSLRSIPTAQSDAPVAMKVAVSAIELSTPFTAAAQMTASPSLGPQSYVAAVMPVAACPMLISDCVTSRPHSTSSAARDLL
mmetsp:Transcript_88226/g.227490  ORF Transcript_88226/g.227490 Transcript_88226/m.227490 type:complete len:238 (-) Transcript_88226:150-863(-)